MKLTKKQVLMSGMAVLACLPCCLPSVAPLLAWLGISTIGAIASGWYIGMASAFILGAAAILILRHRAAVRRAASSQCGCEGTCQINDSCAGTRKSS